MHNNRGNIDKEKLNLELYNELVVFSFFIFHVSFQLYNP